MSENIPRRQPGELLRHMLRVLDCLTADELYNRVVFLQQFREEAL